MIRLNTKSQPIRDLEDIYKKQGTKAMEAYINKLGSPLVEAIDDLHDQVTYLYLGTPETENVRLLKPGTFENLEDHSLTQLEDSKLWYSVYQVRNHLRYGYFYLENDDPELEMDARFKDLKDDPLNPFYRTYNDMDLNEKKHSLVGLTRVDDHIWACDFEGLARGTLETLVYKSHI